jgi:hypothetical protein
MGPAFSVIVVFVSESDDAKEGVHLTMVRDLGELGILHKSGSWQSLGQEACFFLFHLVGT